MTKSELVDRIARRFQGLPAADVRACIDYILDAMADTLNAGGRIEIRDFGSFDIKYRTARTGRNPRTAELVAVPGKFVPHFKPGKALRERVAAEVARDARGSGDELGDLLARMPPGTRFREIDFGSPVGRETG